MSDLKFLKKFIFVFIYFIASMHFITILNAYEEVYNVSSCKDIIDAVNKYSNRKIILNNDIIIKEDLRFNAFEDVNTNINLDLNGFTLKFLEEKNIFVGDLSTKINLTISSGKSGSTIIFLYNNDDKMHGYIHNQNDLILKNITVKSLNSKGENNEYEDISFSSLIEVSFGTLLLENTNIFHENSWHGAICNWIGQGKVIINNSTIDVVGKKNKNELRPPFSNDSIIIKNSSITSFGYSSLVVEYGKELKIINSFIIATGKESIGVKSNPVNWDGNIKTNSIIFEPKIIRGIIIAEKYAFYQNLYNNNDYDQDINNPPRYIDANNQKIVLNPNQKIVICK